MGSPFWYREYHSFENWAEFLRSDLLQKMILHDLIDRMKKWEESKKKGNTQTFDEFYEAEEQRRSALREKRIKDSGDRIESQFGLKVIDKLEDKPVSLKIKQSDN